MSDDFDPRVTPVRDDLVAHHLRDRYPRPKQAQGDLRRVIRGRTMIAFSPGAHARRESELLFGEGFIVYDEQDGWAWGQATRDYYVGWVAADALGADIGTPSHEVVVPATYLYRAPDLKSPAPLRLSLASLVVGGGGRRDGAFVEVGGGGWIFADHLAPREASQADYIATGMSLVGVPYLWGGRGIDGMDCSGFLQIVLQRAGLTPPRDSDQQEAVVGAILDHPEDLSVLRRGDLLFFPGHVGIVLDGWRLLHANAHDMAVSVQRLSDVVDRARAEGAPARAARRIWSEVERRTAPRR